MAAEGIRIITSYQTPEQIRQTQEANRMQTIRDDALVPIYVMWTSNVPDLETRASVEGVYDTVRASGQNREVIVFGSQAFGTGGFSSPDWYIKEALRRQYLRRTAGFGPQVDVNEVMGLFYEEPYQADPHWEVFIVNNDLNDRGINGQYLNFIFGSTNPDFPASVQSVTRLLSSVPDNQLRYDMTRRLLRHEVGHMFKLPSGLRTVNVTENLGKHCTNICTMRQGISIEEWAQLTQQETTRDVHFCNDCTNDLTRFAAKYRRLLPHS